MSTPKIRRTQNNELLSLESSLDGHKFNYQTGEWEMDSLSAEDRLQEYQERTARLEAVSGVYQRANRIVSRDSNLTVTVVNDPEMDKASNDGRNVVFNANLIDDLDTDNILSLHGLNFHELSHILFSPRAGSNLAIYAKENNMKRALNLLEESRSENYLIAKYPNTRHFLEANAMTTINDNTIELADYFPLMTGRTYLPLDIRQGIADKFIAKYGKELASELHSIIHEYRTLVFPRDYDKAKSLLTRLTDIIGVDDNPNPDMPFPIPHGHNGEMKQGSPLTKTEQERLSNKMGGGDLENMDSSDTTKSHGIKAGTEAGEKVDNPTDREVTDKAKDIANLINNNLERIKNNDYVKRTINETRKAILGSDEMRSLMKHDDYREVPASPSAIVLARRFGYELERMVRDNDPKWDKFNSRGKLNITRTMNPDINAIRTHFDQWDTGNPNTDIEAVILMDTSGSMYHQINTAIESAWIMKRGIEAIDGDVTFYTFDNDSHILYDKSEKAKSSVIRRVFGGGGTNPLQSLMEAERILTSSKKSIKMLLVVTDGEWGYNSVQREDTIIKRLNDMGVITCTVFLGDIEHYNEQALALEGCEGLSLSQRLSKVITPLSHGATHFHAVLQGKDIIGVAQALVKGSLNTNRAVA